MGIKNTLHEIQSQKLPWIVFWLAEQYYAINSRHVASIGLLDQNCADIPQSPSQVRGLVYFRGKPVRILDLRILLGYQTLTQDSDSFTQMIEKSKSDHLVWMEQLEQSVENGTKFSLTTNPHQCAFGRWYDTYRTKNNELQYVLHMIDEPHQKLHQTAQEMERHIESNSIKKAHELLQYARENYVHNILRLLDELIRVRDDSRNELMLVMENGSETLAVAVDKVVGVKEIELLADENVETILQGSYSLGIAKVEGVKRPVILLDDQALFEQAGV